MMFEDTLLDTIACAALLTSFALCWVIVLVRIVGLRAFSKMTAFDFVVTIAIGSLLAGASQASTWAGFAQAGLAIATLLGAQFLVARIRQSSDLFETAIQNPPVLLMRDGVILQEALDATRVAREDLIAKLRDANVLRFSDVRAVVLETIGDMSVLHGGELENGLLDGVKCVE